MKNELEIDKDDNKLYYLDNQLHREDGPAVEGANGDKYWYLNGKLHRVDGPAVEYSNGDKRWFINNEEVIVKNNDNNYLLKMMKLKPFW